MSSDAFVYTGDNLLIEVDDRCRAGGLSIGDVAVLCNREAGHDGAHAVTLMWAPYAFAVPDTEPLDQIGGPRP